MSLETTVKKDDDAVKLRLMLYVIYFTYIISTVNLLYVYVSLYAIRYIIC